MNSAKLYMFRGELSTSREIGDALGILPSSVARRVRDGLSLEMPPRKFPAAGPSPEKQFARAATSDEDMVLDDRLRFEDDIGARVALRLCGGRCTQDDLALLYGVTYQAIQHVERKALTRFRAAMERLGLAEQMRENMLSRNAIRRESYADKLSRMAPGRLDLKDWNKEYSISKIAALSGRGNEVNKEAVEYSQRGAASRRRRLGLKARAA